MTDHERRIRDALAAGPTEGGWRDCGGFTPQLGALCSDDGYIVYGYADPTVHSEHGTPIRSPSSEKQWANRRFIAACNPSAIRVLLADLDAMRFALQLVVEMLDECNWSGEFDEITNRCEAALKGAAHE